MIIFKSGFLEFQHVHMHIYIPILFALGHQFDMHKSSNNLYYFVFFISIVALKNCYNPSYILKAGDCLI